MLQRFRAKKSSILDKLLGPEEGYTDASPKGSIDAEIRALVYEINKAPGCVTTSSCAGRIAVYLDGAPKVSTEPSTTAASGGKGGGKWIYTSHSPLQLNPSYEPGAIFAMLSLPTATPISYPPHDAAVRYVHFKFEPMILHILCTSGKSAQLVLTAATLSGFRESGISSLFDAKNRQATPMVAVRSSGLSFDSVIAFQDAAGQIIPMVEEGYLRTLIQLANARFEKNTLRKARFKEAFDPNTGIDHSYAQSDYEPARVSQANAERTERREHIARQMEIKAGSGSDSGHD